MNPRNTRIATTTLCLLTLFILHVFAIGSNRDRFVQDEIVVSEGTAVKVITTAEITSKQAKPNDPVGFTVDEDLVINGQVVVRKGTEAIGSMVNAEKGGYLGIETGMFKGHGKITLDDADRAIAEIQKLKFLDQEKIKAPTVVVELSPN